MILSLIHVLRPPGQGYISFCILSLVGRKPWNFFKRFFSLTTFALTTCANINEIWFVEYIGEGEYTFNPKP